MKCRETDNHGVRCELPHGHQGEHNCAEALVKYNESLKAWLSSKEYALIKGINK